MYSPPESHVDRLAALEKQVGWLRLAVIVFPVVTLGLGAAAGNSDELKTKTVNAERINIWDNDGNKRIEIGVNDEKPYIILGEQSGKTRLWIGMKEKGTGPGILMRDGDSVERLYLGVPKDTTGPFLRFAGSDGKAWQHMGKNPNNGVPYIELDDENGKLLWGVGGSAVER